MPKRAITRWLYQREFFDLLAACAEYSRKGRRIVRYYGAGPLMKVWGFYKGSGHLPHRAEIREALDHIEATRMLSWIRLSERCTFSEASPGMSLDPGGVGKGYAVDKMVKLLRANGINIGPGVGRRQQHLWHRRAAHGFAGLVHSNSRP